jgi:hypothetical protein
LDEFFDFGEVGQVRDVADCCSGDVGERVESFDCLVQALGALGFAGHEDDFVCAGEQECSCGVQA